MDIDTEAVIVAIGRSPITRGRKGALKDTHPIEFAAQVLRGVLKKVPQLNPEEIGDVVVGCAMPFGMQGYNIARLIAQRAELPDSVPGLTINRFCSSGLQSIAVCANAILSGQEEIMVAGGVESMSMVPMGLDPKTYDTWLDEHKPGTYMSMGMTAENVAERFHVTREEMDALAVASHRKAAWAQSNGWFDDQIIPICITDENGVEQRIVRDEGIRPGTSMEGLAQLKPCFKENGLVTAATSSQVSDGAGFAVLMSRKKAEDLNIVPIARFLGFSAAGVPSDVMGLGPIQAVPKVMKKTGLQLSDMDVVELNEAFAAQAIPCIRELEMEPDKVNPMGGAMALGHPMGATGIFLTSKALSWLKRQRGRYALVTMCVGGGMGAAAIFELLQEEGDVT